MILEGAMTPMTVSHQQMEGVRGSEPSPPEAGPNRQA
jgi:hypothetical protein